MIDARRKFQIDKATSDPSHDYHKFGTGKYYRELSLYLNLHKPNKIAELFLSFFYVEFDKGNFKTNDLGQVLLIFYC